MLASAKHLGYRIGTSDRTIGGATGASNGFTVVNTSNNKVFIAQSGLWTNGGTISVNTAGFNITTFLNTTWKQS